ncbi:MAG: SDR family NAD(P)-dependent oxidoreductase, partial [Bacteroidota bacterium]
MSSQNVFITGASKGIGEGLVLEYVKRGHRLVICARSEDSLKGLSEKINSAGGECYYIVCDVTSRADVEKAVDFSLEKLGSIDIAILNAGIGEHNRFDNFDVESMEKTFRVNVFGLVYGLAYLIPLMKKQGSGKIAG